MDLGAQQPSEEKSTANLWMWRRDLGGKSVDRTDTNAHRGRQEEGHMQTVRQGAHARDECNQQPPNRSTAACTLS